MLKKILYILYSLTFILNIIKGNKTCTSFTPMNNCVTFSVGQGTGCEWMCNYCSTQLGTNNYYFKDNVCIYQQGGCVGTPYTGVSYTCCSL